MAPLKQRIVQVHMGLRTGTDPTMLADGELTRADDAEYLKGDMRIHKVKSRQEFNSSAESSAILGGFWAQYEGGTDQFITVVDTVYRKADSGATGSFADLVTGLTAPTHLEGLHYENKHHALDGVNRIRNIDKDGTVAFTGMLASTVAPGYSNTGVGTGFKLNTATFIWYWVEERVKLGSTILRRNAATEATILQITGDGSTIKPVITRPDAVNSDATHWALFATQATTGTDTLFPVGAEIAEVVIATTTIEDTRTAEDPGIPSGTAYEITTVSLGGASTSVPKWGQPPEKSNTGDIFEDSLVVNDLDNLANIYWSFFDTPDAWPSINVMRVGSTKHRDTVVVIRRLGNILAVLCLDSLWRVHMLPTGEDAAFQPQRVRERGHDAHGATGPKAADVFNFGQGDRLGYISREAVMITNGFSWDDISDDLDFEATFDISALDEAVLIYNPAKFRLCMYARPVGGTANSVGYYFNVHPSHNKPSRPGGLKAKMTGPITVPNVKSAFIATVDGKRRLFVCADDGKLYMEDEKDSDDSGNGISFVVQTAEVFPSGAGRSSDDKRVGTHHSAGATGQTAGVTLTGRIEGKNDESQTRLMDVSRRELTHTHAHGKAGSFLVKVENTDNNGSFSVDYVVLGVEPGEETQQ